MPTVLQFGKRTYGFQRHVRSQRRRRSRYLAENGVRRVTREGTTKTTVLMLPTMTSFLRAPTTTPTLQTMNIHAQGRRRWATARTKSCALKLHAQRDSTRSNGFQQQQQQQQQHATSSLFVDWHAQFPHQTRKRVHFTTNILRRKVAAVNKLLTETRTMVMILFMQAPYREKPTRCHFSEWTIKNMVWFKNSSTEPTANHQRLNWRWQRRMLLGSKCYFSSFDQSAFVNPPVLFSILGQMLKSILGQMLNVNPPVLFSILGQMLKSILGQMLNVNPPVLFSILGQISNISFHFLPFFTQLVTSDFHPTEGCHLLMLPNLDR
jgi:hypothetical protein